MGRLGSGPARSLQYTEVESFLEEEEGLCLMGRLGLGAWANIDFHVVALGMLLHPVPVLNPPRVTERVWLMCLLDD